MGKGTNPQKGVTVMYIVIAVIIVLLVLMLIVNNVVFMRLEVSGSSMETTLQDGDVVVASKKAKAKRGDIIIIDKVKETGTDSKGNVTYAYLIKRLIATEGDTVRFETDGLYLKQKGADDFKLVSKATVSTVSDLSKPQYDGDAIKYFIVGKEEVIGKNQILYIGDNVTNSNDSRYYGTTDKKNIVSVVPKWAVKTKKATTFIVKKIISPVKAFFQGKSCKG